MEPHHWFYGKTKRQQPKQVSHSQTRSYNLTPEEKNWEAWAARDQAMCESAKTSLNR